MNEKEDLEELQCFVSNIQNDWKTAYDAQIYITSLSVISNHDWNKLELWSNVQFSISTFLQDSGSHLCL